MKTKEEVQKQVETYLIKTSNHLFLTEDGTLLKIITLNRDGEKYYAVLKIRKDNVVLNVAPIITDNDYKWYGNNRKDILKDYLFPQMNKRKSIPNFKKMRNLVSEIKDSINVDTSKNNELLKLIKDKVAELELIRS